MSKFFPYAALVAAGLVLFALTQAFAHEADRWRYDVNTDGVVNSLDLAVVAQHFGAVPTVVSTFTRTVTAEPATVTPIPSPATNTPTFTPTPPESSPVPTVTASRTPAAAPCEFDEVPAGALAPARVIWCQVAPFNGLSTFAQTSNSWADDFDHGLTNSTGLGPGYRVFEDGPLSFYRAQHWRHANHWMLDYAGLDPDGQEPPYNMGFPSMRPDRSFAWQPLTWTSHGVTRTEPGIVIETDFAAGIADYGPDAWGEIVVTTGSEPAAAPRRSALYVYDGFPNHDTIGCRLHSNGQHTCALFDDTDRGPNDGGRTFEVSFFQNEGGTSPACGGLPNGGGGAGDCDGIAGTAMRFCAGTDPDTNCRDRFRLEVSRTRLALYVNGLLYMEFANLDGTPRLPERFLSQPVYVYLGQSIIKLPHGTSRFHWDRLRVNP